MVVLKRKFWAIESPVLGASFEILTTSLDNSVGKHIKIDMTRQLKGKNAEVVMEVVKKDDKIVGEIISLTVAPSYIRRIMRKGASYIEDSFQCNAKDSKMRLKFLMFTRKKIHRSVRNALRLKAIEVLTEFCKEKNSEDVFAAILDMSIQKELSLRLKKIYPLAFCDIRIANKEK